MASNPGPMRRGPSQRRNTPELLPGASPRPVRPNMPPLPSPSGSDPPRTPSADFFPGFLPRPASAPVSPPSTAHDPTPPPPLEAPPDGSRAWIAAALRRALERTAARLSLARAASASALQQADPDAMQAAVKEEAELDAYLRFQVQTLRRVGSGEPLDDDGDVCASLMLELGKEAEEGGAYAEGGAEMETYDG